MTTATFPTTLLPANRTALELRLSQALATDLPHPTPNRALWDVSALPADLLYVLEWALRVHTLWPGSITAASDDARRRDLIRAAVDLHRHKGTVGAIRRVFRIMGLGEVVIDEGRSGKRRDGTHRRGAFVLRGEAWDNWAIYRITCRRLLSRAQSDVAREMLAFVAPARCHLYELNFAPAALIRDGSAVRNGAFNRGGYTTGAALVRNGFARRNGEYTRGGTGIGN